MVVVFHLDEEHVILQWFGSYNFYAIFQETVLLCLKSSEKSEVIVQKLYLFPV